MAIISKPNTFFNGATIQAAEENSNFDTIYNDYNGNITGSNISASAAIAASKLNLASIAQTITMASVALNFAKGSDIASATTTDIGGASGNFADITGTTTITGLGTIQAGTWRAVRFTGILILTHNATSLILPNGSANITTAANDTAAFVSLGSGNWLCLWYQRADGTPLSGGNFATQAQMETATSTVTTVSPGRVQYHPGVAKAWAKFNGTSAGTNAPAAGYNVTSVTKNSTGNYTINLTTSFSSADYAISAIAGNAGTTNDFITIIKTYSTGSFNLIVENSAGSAADADQISVMAFGDQ